MLATEGGAEREVGPGSDLRGCFLIQTRADERGSAMKEREGKD